MLEYNFERIFKVRGIARPFSYLKNLGFSSSFASKAKNNKTRYLGLREMEKLCALLRCTPNDIVVWTPDSKFEIDPNHPLHSLKKKEKYVDLTRTIYNLPLEKLDEVEAMLGKVMKESEIED